MNRSSSTTGPRQLPLAGIVIAFAGYLLLLVVIQRTAGAPAAAFGAFPDEPAHFVGGLLAHDYMRHALGSNPVSFAREYYVHLPYFAVGVWPPLFYALEGVWMDAFGGSRQSVLWMIAAFGAFLATLLYWVLVRRFGQWTAAAGGAMLLLVPTVQWNACVVMVDLACSLFALVSLLFFARFLETQRWRDSAWFGIFCATALLTKNSTYFVLLVPPIVILAARRWDVLRNWALYLGPAIAVGLYLPWFAVSKSFLLLGIQGVAAPTFWGLQWDYVIALWRDLWLLLPLAGLGAIFIVFGKQRKPDSLSWCLLAVIPAISISIFAARLPIQNRLLILSFVAAIYLLCEFWSAMLPGRGGATGMTVTLVVFGAVSWMRFTPLPRNDIRAAVGFIEARDGSHPGAVVVPSNREGPWIAEFGQSAISRPSRILIRPTKVFGKEDWNGSNWQPFYRTTVELQVLFERMPVKYCILNRSTSGRHYPHDALLESTIAQDATRWRLVFTSESGGYQVYENASWTAAAATQDAVLQELRHTLAP